MSTRIGVRWRCSHCVRAVLGRYDRPHAALAHGRAHNVEVWEESLRERHMSRPRVQRSHASCCTGYFQSEEEQFGCISCDALGDFYQDQPGQSSCLRCPKHTQRFVGVLSATNASSCQCREGAAPLVTWSTCVRAYSARCPPHFALCSVSGAMSLQTSKASCALQASTTQTLGPARWPRPGIVVSLPFEIIVRSISFSSHEAVPFAQACDICPSAHTCKGRNHQPTRNGASSPPPATMGPGTSAVTCM